MNQTSYYMYLALDEARKAFIEDEVPVGAVLIDEKGVILAKTRNQVIRLQDTTAHAEIMAIRRAGKSLNNYRLVNTTLFVTVEPCMMCMGAIIHARLHHVVFGSRDCKWGAAGYLYQFNNDMRLNHHPLITQGVLEIECRQLVKKFFKLKRK